MPTLIGSPIRQYYATPQNIKIGNKTFDGIRSVDTRHYVENGLEQSVNYLDTYNNAEHSVYELNGKVRYVDTRYRQPVTKVIDGKVYNNIMSEMTNYETGMTRYDNFNKNNLPTVITVNREGKTVSAEKPAITNIASKIGNLFKKVFKIAKLEEKALAMSV